MAWGAGVRWGTSVGGGACVGWAGGAVADGPGVGGAPVGRTVAAGPGVTVARYPPGAVAIRGAVTDARTTSMVAGRRLHRPPDRESKEQHDNKYRGLGHHRYNGKAGQGHGLGQLGHHDGNVVGTTPLVGHVHELLSSSLGRNLSDDRLDLIVGHQIRQAIGAKQKAVARQELVLIMVDEIGRLEAQ